MGCSFNPPFFVACLSLRSSLCHIPETDNVINLKQCLRESGKCIRIVCQTGHRKGSVTDRHFGLKAKMLTQNTGQFSGREPGPSAGDKDFPRIDRISKSGDFPPILRRIQNLKTLQSRSFLIEPHEHLLPFFKQSVSPFSEKAGRCIQ